MQGNFTFSIRLSELDHSELNKAAERWGIGKADVVRMAIRAFGDLADGRAAIVLAPPPIPTAPPDGAAVRSGQGVADER
jgi:hypothetical protein